MQPKPAHFTKSLFYMLKNKYALRNWLAALSMSWFDKGGFDWDVVTQMEIMGGALPVMAAYLPYNILNPLSVAFVPFILKVFGGNKRNGVIFFTLLDTLRALAQTLVGFAVIRNNWLFCAFFAFFFALNAADNAPSSVLGDELGREIADYTEYMTGERPDGTAGILPGLIGKVAAPLKALFTVYVFRWTGYDASRPMRLHAQGNFTVYKKAYGLYVLAGCLPNLVQLVPWFFYDLVGEKRDRMYMELNARRALIASEPPAEVAGLETALALEKE
jgi:Na+/melibiose symporter-like transporter